MKTQIIRDITKSFLMFFEKGDKKKEKSLKNSWQVYKIC